MNSVLYPLSSAVALVALLYKLRVLRWERSITQIALVAHFFFLFVTFTFSSPPVWVATSELIGITNFSGLLSQSCVVILSACQQLVLLDLTYGPGIALRRARPRILLLTLALITMVGLFMWNTPSREAPHDFAVVLADSPAYLVVYLAAYSTNQVAIAVMGWRYSKIAPSLWLRRGLRMVAFALPFALAYAVVRAYGVIAALFGTSAYPWEPIAQVSVAAAACVQTVGWILPDWGPHLTGAVDRLRHWRTYRTLSALHRDLIAHVPEPVLPCAGVRDSRTRLYRLAIDVRDAQWALQTWMRPEVARIAHEEADRAGLLGDAYAATVEAIQLQGAIAAMRQNRPPEQPVDTPTVAAPGDLAAELSYLKQLAEAMVSSVVQSSMDRITSLNSACKESP
ncbi:MAB_1171c family putative transporter [Streptomyces sp. NPDC052042]|uniref:MAB_1171c family putative transporter n=1 Tax=Streptomyces sp. NPDC052042 TaxID=3365683 RepID=UPI0037D7DECB